MAARYSWDAAAAVLNERWGTALSGTAVRQAGRRMGLKSQFEATQTEPIAPPPLTHPRYNRPWTLPEGKGWMITGDWHAPYTDWLMVARMVNVARRLGIPNLLIVGDLFNFDSASSHPAIVRGSAVEDDVEAARFALRLCLETFEQVYISSGNHDLWLARSMATKFSGVGLADLLLHLCDGDKYPDRVHWSIYSHALVHSERSGVWRCSHPRNYARNRSATAATLSAKYECHTITHHEHHLNKGVSLNGRYTCVSNGCLVDAEKLAYVRLVDNTMPEMVTGFASLQNGVCDLYGGPPGFTNWSLWNA
jgi:hypothetical protein